MANTKRKSGEVLSEALEAWRTSSAGSAERLSGSSRDRILRRALEATSDEEEAVSSLFVPGRRLAWLGVLPVALLTLALGWLLGPGAPMTLGPEASRAPTIQAQRDGDEVVFLIANGEREHRIYKSDRPDAFGEAPAFATTRGTFRDRLADRSNVVFYRID